MRTLFPLVAATAMIAAPYANAQTQTEGAPLVTPFSTQKAGAELPAGWEVVKITEEKKLPDVSLDQGLISVSSTVRETPEERDQTHRLGHTG